MTRRILPQAEWDRLAHTELASVWRHLDPAWAQVLVVEDGKTIVGCWALLNIWHVEGLWVASDFRHQAAVQRHLWAGMHELMSARGATKAVTGATDPSVQALLRKHAQPLQEAPGFVIDFGKGEICQRL